MLERSSQPSAASRGRCSNKVSIATTTNDDTSCLALSRTRGDQGESKTIKCLVSICLLYPGQCANGWRWIVDGSNHFVRHPYLKRALVFDPSCRCVQTAWGETRFSDESTKCPRWCVGKVHPRRVFHFAGSCGPRCVVRSALAKRNEPDVQTRGTRSATRQGTSPPCASLHGGKPD
jgi:hypothetical protein